MAIADKSCTDASRKRPGRPPVLSSQERRRQILLALNDLFSEGGLDEVTIASIAARAGMSRRTIYEIFGDRESLLLAYMDELISTCLQPLAPEHRDLPLRDRLHVMFDARTEWGAWDLPLAILRQAIANAPEAPNLGLRCREIGAGRVEALLREELDLAVADGEIRPVDTALAAAILRDMIQVPIVDALLDKDFRPDAGERGARTTFALRIFLDGVGAPEGRRPS